MSNFSSVVTNDTTTNESVAMPSIAVERTPLDGKSFGLLHARSRFRQALYFAINDVRFNVCITFAILANWVLYATQQWDKNVKSSTEFGAAVQDYALVAVFIVYT